MIWFKLQIQADSTHKKRVSVYGSPIRLIDFDLTETGEGTSHKPLFFLASISGWRYSLVEPFLFEILQPDRLILINHTERSLFEEERSPIKIPANSQRDYWIAEEFGVRPYCMRKIEGECGVDSVMRTKLR